MTGSIWFAVDPAELLEGWGELRNETHDSKSSHRFRLSLLICDDSLCLLTYASSFAGDDQKWEIQRSRKDGEELD